MFQKVYFSKVFNFFFQQNRYSFRTIETKTKTHRYSACMGKKYLDILHPSEKNIVYKIFSVLLLQF